MDELTRGLTSLTAAAPVPSRFEGGCLPCQQRQGLAVEPTPDVETDPTVAWEGVLGVEGEMTGDGRLIEPEALRVYDLPIPLRYVASDVGAHDGAVVVGTIDEIERLADEEMPGRVLLYGRGRIDLETEFGVQAARGLEKLTLNGVSMDLDDVSFEVRIAAEVAERMAEGGAEVSLDETDDDGNVKVASMSSTDEIRVTTSGRIRAATIVSIPAFAAAKLKLSANAEVPDSVTASAPLVAFNWVDDAGGLPKYVKRIADHLIEKGMTQSHAIATAVNVCKKACSTGDVNFPGIQHENAKSQADACAAVTEWEEKKAKAKAKHSSSTETLADAPVDSGSEVEDDTVADLVETIPADHPDETECAFPDCDAPASLLVPVVDDPDEEIDPDEGPVDGMVPYCEEHGQAVLEEIGDLPAPTPDSPEGSEDFTLDADVLAELFSPETIEVLSSEYDIIHAPAGTPIGGQFISPEGGSPSSSDEEGQAQEKADADTIKQLSKLSAKALEQVMANLQSAEQGMTDPTAKAELQHLMQDVTTAQANVAKTAKSAKSGGSSKSSGGGSSKRSSGGGSKKTSSKGGSSSKKTAGKSGSSAAKAKAKAEKEQTAKAKAAERAKAKAEKAKERQEAKDKRDADRATKQIQASAARVAKAHAAEIKKTQTELNGYYKKFHSKISPEERGKVQESIDTCTATLKKLQAEESADSLTAAAAPEAPPQEWFENPHLTEPTALTITDEGRVYGHLAAWNTCHTSHTAQGQCVLAPRSASSYAYFHTGAVRTAEGTEVPVGHITMDARHAKGNLSPAATMSHYEDTGTTIADIASGEDEHGIWFSGALRPWATEKQIRQLRSSPLSGDWRRIGSGLELVAALAVNVPGFPIPRPQGLVAGGAIQSLVASGMIEREVEDESPESLPESTDTLSAEEIESLRELAKDLRAQKELATRREVLARRAKKVALRARFEKTMSLNTKKG